MSKPFWQSRTFWINGLAGVLAFAQSHFGWNLGVTPEEQVGVLVVANLILRAVTKGAVTLS